MKNRQPKPESWQNNILSLNGRDSSLLGLCFFLFQVELLDLIISWGCDRKLPNKPTDDTKASANGSFTPQHPKSFASSRRGHYFWNKFRATKRDRKTFEKRVEC
uniref:Uncharacterized protein n=1 Tax=Heterosigma akashiwo TaxID=2829 RepID=A0A7S3UWJ3_HETAK